MKMRQTFVTTVDHKNKRVKVSLGKEVLTFPMVKKALIQVKKYLGKNYQVVVEGYFAGREYSREVKAFLFALEVLGQKNRVILIDKAGYRKAERRKLREKVEKLYVKGKRVKELAKQFKIPEKTVYRWVKTKP
jgi:hypothetical protein